MSYCFNLSCQQPQNPQGAKFCQNCGMRLLLGDRYQAFNPLGSGNSSRTFLGIDTLKRFDSRCLIKQFSNGSRAASFRQEAARLDQIGQHPQVPDLLAYFERGQQQYLVQEFISGQNLLQQLTEKGTFDEAQIRQVLVEILPLLQFLHDRQIVHRDIKPINLIRRSSDQQLMLVDFGAAKHVTKSAMAKTGTLLGSAEYAAPEQLMGKAIAPSDLYSLGVTCIHLLTGLRPFDLFNSADGQWIWRSVSSPVSDALAQVIDKLLRDAASQRYQSAIEVLLALEGAALGGSANPITQKSTHSKAAISQVWECVSTLTVNTAVNAIALSPDRRWLAIAGDDATLQLWDLEQQKQGIVTQKTVLTGHTQPVTTVAWTEDGITIVSGSRDQTIRLWNLASGSSRLLNGHQDGIAAVAIVPNQPLLLSGSGDQTVKLWNLETGQLLHTFTEHRAAVGALALNPSSSNHASLIFASGDTSGEIKIWHLGTKELLRSLPSHTAAVNALAISADQQVISGSWDMTLTVRNLNAGGLRHTLTGHLLPVVAIAVMSDDQIATGSHDQTIRLWNLRSGQSLGVLTGHIGTVTAIVSASEHFLISGSQDGTVKFWQTTR